MKKFFGRIIRAMLGIDDTELPNGQYAYLKDISKTVRDFKLNVENLALFIDSLKEKHDIVDIALYKGSTLLFSTELDALNQTQALFEIFLKYKPLINEKIIHLKHDGWITVFEKENYVFIVKKHAKPNEIELNAIASDVLMHLGEILNAEAKMAEAMIKEGELNG